MADEERRPVLRVVRGDATPEEIAALVAVVTARAAAAAGTRATPGRRGAWGHPRHALREPLQPGPGAWRASGFPR
ncbi:acyl-CoA carboxylase subunit epsilon [Bailinhaonella thermotolerans]|uniref:Acyl-CoA carboxylase subunit epsilon n=1 Tax=Bailinhaonella thermotolerans TaxID=1070861 RepID=A0A3A4BGD5_9ACTN|nr:acyl-CoA carboxylase subunit epsilon [Bailinhaonella thermotolerans]RJL33562.1 acyl-CoA carboxylase subunit epsilon [Bailinhaonella thermotolerans]